MEDKNHLKVKEILRQIDIFLAGKTAFDMFYERHETQELFAKDLIIANKFMNYFVSTGLLIDEKGFYFFDEEKDLGNRDEVDLRVAKFINQSEKRTHKFLKKKKALVKHVAHVLLDKGSMSGKELERIIEETE